jgi:hypothetical protein
MAEKAVDKVGDDVSFGGRDWRSRPAVGAAAANIAIN